jgi:hypothetical protein
VRCMISSRIEQHSEPRCKAVQAGQPVLAVVWLHISRLSAVWHVVDVEYPAMGGRHVHGSM